MDWLNKPLEIVIAGQSNMNNIAIAETQGGGMLEGAFVASYENYLSPGSLVPATLGVLAELIEAGWYKAAFPEVEFQISTDTNTVYMFNATSENSPSLVLKLTQSHEHGITEDDSAFLGAMLIATQAMRSQAVMGGVVLAEDRPSRGGLVSHGTTVKSVYMPKDLQQIKQGSVTSYLQDRKVVNQISSLPVIFLKQAGQA